MNFDVSLDKTNRFDESIEKISQSSSEAYTSTRDFSKKIYGRVDESIKSNVANWLGTNQIDKIQKDDVLSLTSKMYKGYQIDKENHALGLKKLSEYKLNKDPQFRRTNILQQSGFAAEIISTNKENLMNKIEGNSIRVSRADDLPEMFVKNDPFVDKVRIDTRTNEVVDRIQTKFVGSNANECFKQLNSPRYEKYLTSEAVTKIEVPKDYFDEIKNIHIPNKIAKLKNQLLKFEVEGNVEKINSISDKINRLNLLDQKLEKSLVSRSEAIFARKHPKLYVGSFYSKGAGSRLLTNLEKTLENKKINSAFATGAITASIETVDGIKNVVDGKLTVKEAVEKVAVNSGVSTLLSVGEQVVSDSVSLKMANSSYKLISSSGNLGIPAVVISTVVTSYDSIMEYCGGKIDGKQLVYDLGENSSGALGGVAGSGLSGAALGSIVPGAGNVAGFAVGALGGMVGCAVSSGAYKTAVELGGQGAEVLVDKSKEFAQNTIDLVSKNMPEKVNDIKSAFNEFATKNNLPFSV